MNFKLFTTALLATGATAAYTSEQSALGDELNAKYQTMPEHKQRRFWPCSIWFGQNPCGSDSDAHKTIDHFLG